jgi:Protein of unknown function (DUF4232)
MTDMRVRTAPEIGPLGWLRRWAAFIVVAAVGLAVGACGGSPSGTTARSSVPASASSRRVAGSGSSSPHGDGSAGTAGALPVCQTAELKIAIGPTGANGGMSGGDLEFTNTSSAPCQLAGWPQVVGVTAAGTSTTAVQVNTTLFGPYSSGAAGAVTINAGAAAAVAFIVGANNCTDSYQTLRVTPPGNTKSVVVSAWLPQVQTYLPACAPINVSPLVIASQLPDPASQA